LDEEQNNVTMEGTAGELAIAEELIDRMNRKSGQAADIRAADREPLWIGTAYDQDLRSTGDPIPRLAIDVEQAVVFDAETTAREVYGTLCNTTGLQCVFDLEIDLGQPVSFPLPKLSAEETLEFVNRQFGNFSVIWGPRTIFISTDSESRRFSEEHLAIQFFYLSRAEPRDVIGALRSTFQARQLVEIPRLNAVVVKDTVSTVEAARELVERMDGASVD
jgi:hypothetical protein